jgi:hypothetical protein
MHAYLAYLAYLGNYPPHYYVLNGDLAGNI